MAGVVLEPRFFLVDELMFFQLMIYVLGHQLQEKQGEREVNVTMCQGCATPGGL